MTLKSAHWASRFLGPHVHNHVIPGFTVHHFQFSYPLFGAHVVLIFHFSDRAVPRQPGRVSCIITDGRVAAAGAVHDGSLVGIIQQRTLR